MQNVNKKTMALIIGLITVTLFSGCTNWKKKYENLYVQHQNTVGLLESERAQKGQLAQKVTEGQQTIDELQRQIAELNKSPAEASGFGKGYDVAFDAAAGTITVTLDTAILFDSGKADLRKATSGELDHIASVIESKYPGKRIDVAGHTDNDPIKKSSWKDNWELSAQRALTVVRYLVGKGIPEDSIRASGCGEYKPVAPNTSTSGKAKNRRVEIVVYIR